MIRIAQFGAGRIGQVHGPNLAASSRFELVGVSDPVQAPADALAADLGCSVLTPEEIFADDSIEAVLIASSTDTHAELIEAAVRAGKAAFCEKPIHLDSGRARECLSVVNEHSGRLAMGFNRRYDPNFAELKAKLDAGRIGTTEMVSIISHDAEPPWPEYVKVSGGLYRDMMIHDFDIARWLLGEEPIKVYASGSVLIDPAIGEAGDVDSAMVIMRTASGKLCHINCSRRNAGGYDQRVEVHGSEGKLLLDNVSSNTVSVAGAGDTRVDPPPNFFVERYADSYRLELDEFADGIESGDFKSPTGSDGLNALLLADAATTSSQTGQPVAVQLV